MTADKNSTWTRNSVFAFGAVVTLLSLAVWQAAPHTAFLISAGGNLMLNVLAGVVTLRAARRGTLLWVLGLTVLVSAPSSLTHSVTLWLGADRVGVGVLVLLQMPAALVLLGASWRAYKPNVLVAGQVLLEATMLATSGVSAFWFLCLRAQFHRGELGFTTLTVLCVNAFVAGLIFVITARNTRPGGLVVGAGSLTLILVDAIGFVVRDQGGLDAVVPVTVVGVLAWCLVIATLARVFAVEDSTTSVLVRSDAMREVLVGGTVGVFVLIVVFANIVAPRIGPGEWALMSVFIIAMWLRDVTQARRTTGLLGQMRNLALHDALTGLPNRRALENDIDWQLPARRSAVGMLTVDIDQFKDVNDLIGHDTGNKLLILVADLLRRLSADSGTVAYRTGGDEFVIVVEGDPAEAEAVAARVVDGLRLISGDLPAVSKLNIGASVGVKHLRASAGGDELRRAMVQSGHAMRASKRQGRGRVTVFDGQLEETYQRRKLIELYLRDMCEGDGAIGLEFQPILDLNLGRVAGVEALARLTHPTLGPVPPQEFVEVAEDAGLITMLGDRILRQAISQMTAPGMLGRDMVLSVNVSVLQLREVGFAERVLTLLAEHGVPRHNLLIEVTESVFVDPASTAATTLTELSRAGVHLAIDDFGAGATSVGYLHSLPVDMVKIDRSIIQAIGSHRSAAGILRGIVEMARPLNLKVVFEGMENQLHQDVAQRLGVQYGQGWLYSAAVPAQELPAVVDRLDEQPHRIAHAAQWTSA